MRMIDRLIPLLEGLATRLTRLEEKQFSTVVVRRIDGINRDGGGGARNPFAVAIALTQKKGEPIFSKTNTRVELSTESLEALAAAPDGRQAIERISRVYRDQPAAQPVAKIRAVADAVGVSPAEAAQAGRLMEVLGLNMPGDNNAFVDLNATAISGRGFDEVKAAKDSLRELAGSVGTKVEGLDALRSADSVGTVARFLAVDPPGGARNWAASVLTMAFNRTGDLSRAIRAAEQFLKRPAALRVIA